MLRHSELFNGGSVLLRPEQLVKLSLAVLLKTLMTGAP
jgi:hypothetical protein